MPVHIEKWSCHFHYDIIAKAIESRNICFFAEVNRKVAYIAILRVGRHPDFDAIFCWFCGHVLPKGKPAFKCNHSLINREILRGLIGFLDILQNFRENWANLIKTIVIIIATLRLCCKYWLSSLNLFFCKNVLNPRVSNKWI